MKNEVELEAELVKQCYQMSKVKLEGRWRACGQGNLWR